MVRTRSLCRSNLKWRNVRRLISVLALLLPESTLRHAGATRHQQRRVLGGAPGDPLREQKRLDGLAEAVSIGFFGGF